MSTDTERPRCDSMTEHESEVKASLKDVTANPAPLGLCAFGLTTVLLNLHNAGLFAMGSMILAMGIFYGGLAHVIAGIMEWKKGNTFGTVAFTSYGFFWLSLVALLLLPAAGLAEASDAVSMASYLFMWGILTAILFIGTLRSARTLQFVFASLAILFFLLGIGDITGSATIGHVAGYWGIVVGASAIYTGLGQVLNEIYGRTVFPLFPYKSKKQPSKGSKKDKVAAKSE